MATNMDFESMGLDMVEKVNCQFIPSMNASTETKRVRFPLGMSRRAVSIICVVALFIIGSGTGYAIHQSFLLKKYPPQMEAYLDRTQGFGLNLYLAEQAGLVVHPMKEVMDKGIRVCVTDVIAGHDSVIVAVNYSGFPPIEYDPTSLRSPLIRSNVINIDMQPPELLGDVADQNNLILLDATHVKHWLINGQRTIMNSYYENDDGSLTEIYEFDCTITETQTMNLHLEEIAGIKGVWDVPFEVPYSEPKVYDVIESYPLSDGLTLYVDKIILDGISTTVQLRYSDPTKGDNYKVEFAGEGETDWVHSYKGPYKESIRPVNMIDGTYEYLRLTMRPLPPDTKTIHGRWRKMGAESFEWNSFDLQPTQ